MGGIGQLHWRKLGLKRGGQLQYLSFSYGDLSKTGGLEPRGNRGLIKVHLLTVNQIIRRSVRKGASTKEWVESQHDPFTKWTLLQSLPFLIAMFAEQCQQLEWISRISYFCCLLWLFVNCSLVFNQCTGLISFWCCKLQQMNDVPEAQILRQRRDISSPCNCPPGQKNIILSEIHRHIFYSELSFIIIPIRWIRV